MKLKKLRKLSLNKKAVLNLSQLNTLQGGFFIKSTNATCTNSTAPQCGTSTAAPTCRNVMP
jgi:natural product precursor